MYLLERLREIRIYGPRMQKNACYILLLPGKLYAHTLVELVEGWFTRPVAVPAPNAIVTDATHPSTHAGNNSWGPPANRQICLATANYATYVIQTKALVLSMEWSWISGGGLCLAEPSYLHLYKVTPFWGFLHSCFKQLVGFSPGNSKARIAWDLQSGPQVLQATNFKRRWFHWVAYSVLSLVLEAFASRGANACRVMSHMSTGQYADFIRGMDWSAKSLAPYFNPLS